MSESEYEPQPLAARLQQIRWLLEVKRAAEALPLLHRLVTSYPEEVDTHCFLSYALYQLQRYGEADQAAGRAIATDPHCEWAYRLRSSALLSLGKAKMARDAAYAAVQLDPELSHSWRCLASAELALNNLPAAQGAAEKARDLAPEDAGAYAALGWIASAGRLLDAAAEQFRRALALDPESLDALNGLGTTLHAKGRNLEAMNLYYQGVRRSPGEKWLRQDLLALIESYLDPPDLVWALIGCFLVLFAPLIVMIRDRQRDQERMRRLNELPPEIRQFYYEERKRKHKA